MHNIAYTNTCILITNIMFYIAATMLCIYIYILHFNDKKSLSFANRGFKIRCRKMAMAITQINMNFVMAGSNCAFPEVHI